MGRSAGTGDETVGCGRLLHAKARKWVARGSGWGEGIKSMITYSEHMTAERHRGAGSAEIRVERGFISDTAEVI